MQLHADLSDVDAGNGEPTVASLQSELAETRRRLVEAEQMLHAIRNGEVDAIIVQGAAGPQAYTLKTASEPYRQIVEQMPEAALTVTADGLIVYCNAAFANMVGRPADRVAGSLLADFVSEDAFEHVVSSGGNTGCDLTIARPDGTVIDCRASSTALPVGGERVYCLILTNLTGQRLKARHDVIVQASSSAIYMLSPQFVIETWNPAAASLYGYAPAEIIGRSSEALCAPDGFEVLKGLAARASGGEPVSSDVVSRHKDGTILDVMVNLAALRDAAGGVNGFVSISLDVSERKRASAELQRVSVLLNTLLQSAPVGFCFLDRHLRYVRVNERLAEINGITAEAHLDRHVSEVVPALVEALREVTDRILATGEPVLDHEFSGETPAAPGLTRFWCEHWYPVRDGAGEIMGFGGIVEDITERKHAEARLRDSEATFRAMFHVSSVGKVEVDPATDRFTRVNAAMCELTGYTEAELLARTFSDITHPDHRDQDRDKVRQLVAGEASDYDVEKRYMRKDGSSVWVRVTANVIRDEAGRPLRNSVVIQNVDARKKSEEKLRESEARYRMAIQAGGLATWENDIESGQRRWSPEAMTIFGLDLAGGIGRCVGEDDELYSRVHPDDDHLRDRYRRELLDAGSITAEYRIILPNGDIRWIAGGGMVLTRDPAGYPVRSVHIAADITERKQAEARLRASEEFARTVLEASPDCLKVIGADGRLEYVNQNGACLLEVDNCSAVIGQPWENLWPDASRPMIRQAIEAARTGQLIEFRAEAPTAKGTLKHWDVSIAAVPVQHGGPVRLLANSRDVTEKIRSEIALIESESRFRSTFENAAVGVAHVALDGAWLSVNAKLCSIVGYSREELLTKTFQDITHPDDLAADMSQLRQVVSGEISSYAMDKRYIRKDGSIVWIGLTVSIQRRENGEPDYFISIVRDISQRVRATEAHREAEARLLMALEAAKAGAWEAVPERGEFFASDQALALHGLAPGTPMTHDAAMSRVLAEDRPGVEAALRQTLDTGVPFRVELRTPQPDGSMRWLSSQAELEPGPGPRRLVGLVQDITEQKQREQQIQLLMGEVNHRAKNLLGVVMSVARQTGGPHNQEFVKQFGDRIQALSASHDLLVNNAWQSVPLASLVSAQLSYFQNLIGTRIEFGGEAVRVSPAAAQTIGMALHELITNASKYGALANDKGRIDIHWQVTGIADSSDSRFSLRWEESDGPPVVAPTRHGFGSVVTGKLVKMSLAGDVTAEFAPSGFVWHLHCPFEKLIE
ncbi:MAG: PAS domain S-box protein [Nitrobacter sp.]